jgi:DNA-binding transcriptional MerR regulator
MSRMKTKTLVAPATRQAGAGIGEDHPRVASAGVETGVRDLDDGEHGDGHFFSIGELADEFDITTRTIRFYESRGLLIPQRLRSNRTYSRRDRARLKLILRGKNLGFSLEDIAEYLSLYDSDPGQVTQTKLLLDKIEAHIADLHSKRRDLERTLGELTEIREQCMGHLQRR